MGLYLEDERNRVTALDVGDVLALLLFDLLEDDGGGFNLRTGHRVLLSFSHDEAGHVAEGLRESLIKIAFEHIVSPLKIKIKLIPGCSQG